MVALLLDDTESQGEHHLLCAVTSPRLTGSLAPKLTFLRPSPTSPTAHNSGLHIIARVGEQELVAAGVTPDAREAFVRIAAGDKAFDDLFFDCASRSIRCVARGAQLVRMALGALPQRA